MSKVYELEMALSAEKARADSQYAKGNADHAGGLIKLRREEARLGKELAKATHENCKHVAELKSARDAECSQVNELARATLNWYFGS